MNLQRINYSQLITLRQDIPHPVPPYVPDGIRRSPINMTNNSTPSPFVVAVLPGNVDGGFAAFLAFDGDTGTFAVADDAVNPAGWTIDLGALFYVASYKVRARAASSHFWIDWTVSGSPNGSSWTQIDSRTGQSWTGGEEKTFNITGPVKWRHVKFDISLSQSGTQTVEAASIEIFS